MAGGGHPPSARTPREISSLVAGALDLVGIDGPARWDVLAESAAVLTLLLETRLGFLVLKLAPGCHREAFEARAAIYGAVGARGLSPRPVAVGQVGAPTWCVLALEFVRGATVECFAARTLAAAGRLAGRLDRALRDLSESCRSAQTLPAIEIADLLREAARAAHAAPRPWRAQLVDAAARLERSRPRAPERLRLAHGDFHFGNILRTRRGFVAVDLDEAGWAVPGFDLATLLAQPMFADGDTRARAVVDAYVEHAVDGGAVLAAPCLVSYLVARLTWLLSSNAARAAPRQLARGMVLLSYSLDVVEGAGSLFDWVTGLPASR